MQNAGGRYSLGGIDGAGDAHAASAAEPRTIAPLGLLVNALTAPWWEQMQTPRGPTVVSALKQHSSYLFCYQLSVQERCLGVSVYSDAAVPHGSMENPHFWLKPNCCMTPDPTACTHCCVVLAVHPTCCTFSKCSADDSRHMVFHCSLSL